MKGSKKSFGISDILLIVAAVIYLVGVFTVFSACGPKDDGSWMTCHWAGQIIKGLSVTVLITSLVHALIRNSGIKAGISIAMIPEAVLSMLVPGVLVNLCMMNNMHCHTMMRPGTCICSGFVLVMAVMDIFLQYSAIRNQDKNSSNPSS